MAAGHNPPMTTEFSLDDESAERLLTVLEKNENAVKSAVRWTPEAAEKIGEIRNEIAEQSN